MGKILFAVSDPANMTPNEQLINDRLEAAGHVVTLILYSNTSWTPAGFDCFIDYTDTANWQEGAYIKEIPILCINYNNYNNSEMCVGAYGRSFAYQKITDNTHYITSPFPLGIFFHYTSTYDTRFIYNYSGDVAKLSQQWTYANEAAVAVIEKGQLLHNGQPAAHARAILAAYQMSLYTANAWTIFDRAVAWLVSKSVVIYPHEQLKKGFNSGYACFLSGYTRAKIAGQSPLKRPDGTPF